jgi:hypothetical protein
MRNSLNRLWICTLCGGWIDSNIVTTITSHFLEVIMQVTEHIRIHKEEMSRNKSGCPRPMLLNESTVIA